MRENRKDRHQSNQTCVLIFALVSERELLSLLRSYALGRSGTILIGASGLTRRFVTSLPIRFPTEPLIRSTLVKLPSARCDGYLIGSISVPETGQSLGIALHGVITGASIRALYNREGLKVDQ